MEFEAEDLSGQAVEVAATWTGAEQENFEQVIALFEEETGADVTFTSAGDDIVAFLGPRIEGGDPPDVAILPQPGTQADLAAQGALVSIEECCGETVDGNYGPGAREVGSVDGTLYSVWWKAAQKSTVWYNIAVFEDAGVEPPATWEELQTVAQTISDFGVAPYSIGGADGWTLSDLFENVYVRAAGGEMYDQLAKHEIPWTDQSVKDTLAFMADIFDPDLMAGGTDGALQTDFTTSITQVFTDPPTAALIFEADFVGGIAEGEAGAVPGEDLDWFDFPSIEGSDPAVIGGGDLAALLTDNAAAQEFLKFLATPQAAEVWAEIGGFVSPNQNVPLDAYGDEQSRRAAEALDAAGDEARYDLSDLVPSAFGATTGEGIWGILQEFLADPSDIDGAAQALEDAAAAAQG